MKGISLWQPWATLMAAGYKRVETRSWEPRGLHPGQLVAIHAAKHWTEDERELIAYDPYFTRYLTLAQRRQLWSAPHPPLGGVVAIARFLGAFPSERLHNHITKTERAFGNYGPGRYGWVFSEVRPVAIIPARGQQGLFDWDAPAEIANLYQEPMNQPRGRMAELMEELRETLRYPTARSDARGTPELAPHVAPAAPSPAGPTRVVHVNRDAFDVYVGRQVRYRPDLTPIGWGNPYSVGIDGGDSWWSPIDRYRAWVLTQPTLLARLPELRGKRLGCWCAPAGGLPGNLHGRVCHGEVLAALADSWDAHSILETPEGQAAQELRA